MTDIEQLKERMKDLWALGDYPEVAKRFVPAAEALVAAAGIGPGDRVLDVAAGDGNVAVAAAATGAHVTASDFAPSLVAAGRERTSALGLDVRWDQADVEALPYADGTFDAVTSAFGLMFAPRPEVAAAEAFRVVRPGGVVGLAAWTPDGFTGQITELMSEYLPVPMGTAHPIDWGIEATVRRRLAPHCDGLAVTRGAITWEFPSIDDTLAWQEANFGALVAARRALGDRYAELRARFAELVAEWNRGDGGDVRLPAAYLIVVARRDR
ncbi:MAG TPA: methyltransferase domain-containing protein [Baekduia sp.]|uniref:class I SAM-dependent methyltransferase n=1 Tax=Baekduia sp. TaxID=2600305 RepID=UPI002C44C0C6|nr:methyltransferase domain-containing protein [Baekduia sp.]HMJ32507.1 methyltransferase domain-containing protein [Baekduia sp.]